MGNESNNTEKNQFLIGIIWDIFHLAKSVNDSNKDSIIEQIKDNQDLYGDINWTFETYKEMLEDLANKSLTQHINTENIFDCPERSDFIKKYSNKK